MTIENLYFICDDIDGYTQFIVRSFKEISVIYRGTFDFMPIHIKSKEICSFHFIGTNTIVINVD